MNAGLRSSGTNPVMLPVCILKSKSVVHELMRSKLVIIMAGVALAIGLAVAFYVYFPKPVTAPESSVYPEILTGENIDGKSLEQWAQAYWKWNIAFHVDDIVTDPETNLHKCIVSSDPDGIMTFLIDPYAVTYNGKCTISSEKPILVPLLISEWDTSVPSQSATIEDMWFNAKEDNEVFRSWDVNLDNKTIFKKVGNEEVNIKLRDEILVRNSTMFTLEVPDRNKFDMEPGSYDAVVDGYYLILKPLSPGIHSLEYKIIHEQRIPGADLSYVSGDVSYQLIVE